MSIWTRGKLAKTTRFNRRDDDGVFDPKNFRDRDRVLDQLWRIDWKRWGYPHCGVYVISTDSRTPCKIGVSVNPTKRLASLQTSHWRELQISEYRWCENIIDATKVEKEAHKILRSNDKALLGEWFDIRPHQAIEAMEFAALSMGVNLRNDYPQELHQHLSDMAEIIQRNGDIAFHERYEKASTFTY